MLQLSIERNRDGSSHARIEAFRAWAAKRSAAFLPRRRRDRLAVALQPRGVRHPARDAGAPDRDERIDRPGRRQCAGGLRIGLMALPAKTRLKGQSSLQPHPHQAGLAVRCRRAASKSFPREEGLHFGRSVALAVPVVAVLQPALSAVSEDESFSPSRRRLGFLQIRTAGMHDETDTRRTALTKPKPLEPRIVVSASLSPVLGRKRRSRW